MLQNFLIGIAVLLLLFMLYWGYSNQSQSAKPVSFAQKIKSMIAIVDLDPSVFDYNPDAHENDENAEDDKLKGIKFLSYVESLQDEHEIAFNDEPIHFVTEMQSGVYKGLYIPHRPITWWWDNYGQFHTRFAFNPYEVTRKQRSRYVVEVPSFTPTDGHNNQLR